MRVVQAESLTIGEIFVEGAQYAIPSLRIRGQVLWQQSLLILRFKVDIGTADLVNAGVLSLDIDKICLNSCATIVRIRDQ